MFKINITSFFITNWTLFLIEYEYRLLLLFIVFRTSDLGLTTSVIRQEITDKRRRSEFDRNCLQTSIKRLQGSIHARIVGAAVLSKFQSDLYKATTKKISCQPVELCNKTIRKKNIEEGAL